MSAASQESPPTLVGVGRFAVGLVRAGESLAIAATVAMLAATVYDVLARYFFNRPTVWATELSTYFLIALVFLGAGAAQLANANVRVELLVDRLQGASRRTLEQVIAWIAILTVALMTWQAFVLVGNDWRNGSRIFSLLLTPSWLPKTPIAIGLAILLVAMLVEIDRYSPKGDRGFPRSRWLIALVVAVTLAFWGAAPPLLFDTRFDAGSALILAAVWVAAGLTHGLRTALWVVALTGGAMLILLAARDTGTGMLSVLLGAAIVLYLAIGVRIAFALAFVGILAIYFLLPRPFPLTIADRAWTSVNSFALTAVPLFVLMGAVLVRSGLSDQLFTLMARLLARLPGGLAHAGTAGCAVFAAVSGSSVATAATIGTVACPEMMRRGYSERLTFGSIAAGGTLGILIPPSVPMIVYGTTVGVPIATLFIAGIVPGILMMLLFMAVIALWAHFYPAAAPAQPSTQPLSRGAIVDVGAVVVLVAATIVSLYFGVATPSETAAVGAFLALVLSALRGRLTRSLLIAALRETVSVTAFVFLIIVGANLVTFGFDYLKLSQDLMSLATSAAVDRWTIFVIVMLVYIVLGMFLDSISMLVLTLPVVFPLMKQLGFDPVWFGIILVIMAEIGLITPPVGMNLFVLQGIGRGVAIRTIAIGALPFLGAMLVTVLLLCIEPDIALWLTRAMK